MLASLVARQERLGYCDGSNALFAMDFGWLTSFLCLKFNQEREAAKAMRRDRMKSLYAAGAIAIALTATATIAGETTPKNSFAAELLEVHNQERAQFGSPKLQWSQKLAREAQQWAQILAREGRMRHASNAQRKGAGENLWMGSAGDYSARYMIEAFAAEKRHFKAGIFPHISRTGDWRDVGHYTQVVWEGTREVGCAVVRNARDDFLVCRYWPAGNTYGAEIRRLAAR